MKSRKIVASTVALLVLFVTTLWFVGCENGTGGEATTPEGGGISGSGTGGEATTPEGGGQVQVLDQMT